MRKSRLLTFLLASLVTAGTTAAQTRANIVWIWADNLAYGDLSIYGSNRVKTPVIDRCFRHLVLATQP